MDGPRRREVLLDLRAELRAVVAIARKDLRVLSRYPLEVVNSVGQPIYQFVIPSVLLGSTFLVGGRAVGLEETAGTGDVAGFLILGMVIAYLVGGAFWSIGYSFKREMDQATLEPTWLSPVARETLVLGRALTALILTGVGIVLVLLLGVFAFGMRLSPAVVLALPSFALAALAVLGVAFLISSAVLLVKEPIFWVDSADALFSAASGVSFPITVLPAALKVVSFALPTTYAVDLFRVYGLGARPLLPPLLEYAALAVLAAILLPLGRAVLLWADRRLREQGTVGQH